MTRDLFDDPRPVRDGAAAPSMEFAPGAALLHGFAASQAPSLWAEIERVAAAAPFRHMLTPGGSAMSAAMTNCGALGWISDRKGYRYAPRDSECDRAWPPMPAPLLELATSAARRAGFENFRPDSCLINRYEPGARLGLHQDKDERDFEAPIVSVSLGLPVTFLFGGLARADKTLRIGLQHGDVVVWGGPARLRHHGVLALKPGRHPLTGAARINLTFRKAG